MNKWDDLSERFDESIIDEKINEAVKNEVAAMNNIKWEDGAVCFSGGAQIRIKANSFSAMERLTGGGTLRPELRHIDVIIAHGDFQLNEMRQGDYIKTSDLRIESDFNNAIDAFESLGYESKATYRAANNRLHEFLFTSHKGHLSLCASAGKSVSCVRELTYPQLMAIGKLKRAMIERDSKSAPKITPDLTPDIRADEWTDKHYNNFYQLTEEDIKTGQIKIDAYFVNRMWKISSWDDTGAGFHILKTLPRIANNKNPLKRELVAIKKQVDLLCKMHGVDSEDLK